MLERFSRFLLGSALPVALFGAASCSVTQTAPTASPARGEAAAPPKVVCVKGEGKSYTRELALKDAYRDAIEHAVGFFFDAEQKLKNDDMVKNNTLTHSNAYIERYEEKKVSSRGGLVTVEILAWVRRGEPSRKLTGDATSSTTNLTEASRNIHARIVTRDKRDSDAGNLIEDVFGEFDPLSQLMTVTVDNAHDPDITPSEDSQDAKVLSYRLKFRIDADRYFKVWMPRLDMILRQVSRHPGRRFGFSRLQNMDDVWKTVETDLYSRKHRTDYFAYDRMQFMYARLLDDVRILYGDGCCFGLDRDYDHVRRIVHRRLDRADDAWNQWHEGHRPIRRWGTVPEMRARSKLYVALVKKADAAGCSGMFYELDAASAEVISSWMSEYSGMSKTRCFDDDFARFTNYRLSCRNSSGREIVGVKVRAYNHDMTNVGCVCWGDEGHGNRDRSGKVLPYVIYITPWVGCFAGEASTWVDVEVRTDDIPKIEKLTVAPQR